MGTPTTMAVAQARTCMNSSAQIAEEKAKKKSNIVKSNCKSGSLVCAIVALNLNFEFIHKHREKRKRTPTIRIDREEEKKK